MLIYDIRPPINKAEQPLYEYTTRAGYIRAVKDYNEAQRIIDLRQDNSWIWIEETSNITDKQWKEFPKSAQIKEKQRTKSSSNTD